MYDIEYNIERGNLSPLTYSPYIADEIAILFERERDFLDMTNACVYIPDIGDGNLYGVMVAELVLSELDDDDAPVEWALENIPAPGTGAPNRMVLLTVEEAVEEITSRAEDFAIVC